MTPHSTHIQVLTNSVSPGAMILRPNRALMLADLRRRNGFSELWASVDEWSEACLRGEVPEFEPNKFAAKWLSWAREQKKENGETEFPDLLQVYLARKFDVRDEWTPRTVEAEPLTDADHLLAAVELVDTEKERGFYAGRPPRTWQYSSPEPPPDDFMVD